MSLLNQFMTPANEARMKQSRAQGLTYKNGYAVFRDEAPGIGGEELTSAKVMKEKTVAAAGFKGYDPELTYGSSRRQAEQTEYVPAHVAYDKVVFRFNAYFKEAVPESPDETYRVRHCVIHYFYEDDSILVTERRSENAGIPQGKLIKRQHIPKNQYEYYTLNDLNLGTEVTFYGRTFRIASCDEFTRRKMEELGIQVNPPEEVPEDPYMEKRKKLNSHERTPKFDANKLALRKFLANDRKVLRFYGVWDDRRNMYGEVHKLVLRYFLVDDTVEVREIVSPNSGLDPFYLKRTKLPKHFTELTDIKASTYYTDEDFEIGAVINIFGRPMEIHDCDEFTTQYYQRLGRDMTPITEYQFEDDNAQPKVNLPPYNGFGSEEDSLSNCLSLVPKPPRKNLAKLIELDRKVLRFFARMNTNSVEDKDRRFVITFHPADDTVSIYEPVQRNSGIIGGKFLQRQKLKIPGTDHYYKASDFFVGGEVRIFNHRFVLMEADEYALSYMESDPNDFPRSNLELIQANIRQRVMEGQVPIEEVFANMDKDGSGFLNYDEFKAAIVSHIDAGITDHEIITIMRRFDRNNDGVISYREFVQQVFPETVQPQQQQ